MTLTAQTFRLLVPHITSGTKMWANPLGRATPAGSYFRACICYDSGLIIKNGGITLMIISLVLWIVVFLAVTYLAWWVCEKFGVPRPIFWLIGLILLLILLYRFAGIAGVRLP